MTMLTKNKTEILNINITELYIASKKNLNKDEIVCNKQLKISDTLSYISNSKCKIKDKIINIPFFNLFSNKLSSIINYIHTGGVESKLNKKSIKYKFREIIHKDKEKKINIMIASFKKELSIKNQLNSEPRTEPFNQKEIAIQNMAKLINHIEKKPEYLLQEGILRKSATAHGINKINNILKSTENTTICENFNPTDNINVHAVFAVLKAQLKLALTFRDKMDILNFAKEFDEKKNNYTIQSIDELPLPIQKIMPLFIKVVRNKYVNEMSADNIAIVIAPDISPTNENTKQNMERTRKVITFLAKLIDTEHRKSPRNPTGPLSKISLSPIQSGSLPH
ncbi:hypothetical protein D5F51_18875 [Yersinia hibernica]|uniref:Rho-GAP domain-containing protein n=3 Tax=Yersinia hibernica TaxID=2339259 RepID=A0ABX5R4H0_9GAMM|nr:hypothetical protein D5F51_18875 [Yersinia hibernica]